jgi:hypothetical protein
VIPVNKRLFKPGQVVATPGAVQALERSGSHVRGLLARHLQGQWGDLSDNDRRLNDEAVKDGSRIVSAYVLKTGVKVVVSPNATIRPARRSPLDMQPFGCI